MDGSRRAKPRRAVRAAREADLQLLLPPGRRLGYRRGPRLDRLPRGVAETADAARPCEGAPVAVRDRYQRVSQPEPLRAAVRGGPEPSAPAAAGAGPRRGGSGAAPRGAAPAKRPRLSRARRRLRELAATTGHEATTGPTPREAFER